MQTSAGSLEEIKIHHYFIQAFHDRVSVTCNKEWTDVIELAGKNS